MNINLNDIFAEEPKQKRMRPRKPFFLIPIIITIVIAAIVLTALTLNGNLPFVSNKINELLGNTSNSSSSISSTISVSEIPSTNNSEETTVIAPQDIKGITLDSYDTALVNSSVQYCTLNNLNTIIVPSHIDGNYILGNTGADYSVINFIIDLAHNSGILVVIKLDITAISYEKIDYYGSHINKAVDELLKTKKIDGFMLSGYSISTNEVTYEDYLRSGSSTSYDNYLRNRLSAVIKNICNKLESVSPSMFTMLECDAVWAKSITDNRGIQTELAVEEAYTSKYADTVSWINDGLFDFCVVNNIYATTNNSLSFKTVTSWWKNTVGDKAKLCINLSSSLVGSKQKGWSNPDQLTRQQMSLKELSVTSFCFDSYTALANDKTGSTSVMFKYLSGNLATNYVLKDLTFTSPSNRTLTVTENKINFVGASDPQFPLTLNGKDVARTEFGYFSIEHELNVGKNTFNFSHKGKAVTYNITYRYIVLKTISPANNMSIKGSSTMVVSCVARQGSKVSATFNGQTISLSPTVSDTEEQISEDSSFGVFSAAFTLPDNYTADKSYGKVVFKATHNGITESLSSGNITVLKTEKPNVVDTTIYPSGSDYINVGAGLIGEVVKYQAETFTGKTVDDKSLAYNNYLPKGTVDYVSPNNIFYGSNEYVLMRCGKRLYSKSKNVQNVKVYSGTLPSTNNISVASTVESDRYTTITLNTDWKAPFDFQLKNQKYNSDRSIGEVTFSYVSINFCYAGTFNGSIELDPNNPIFSGYEIIKNEIDYTLILKLRKTAAFYGWYAEYNSKGQLVFKFLKPAKISAAQNDYGVSLNGVKIFVDAGHGGSDGGSPGAPMDESDLNLLLAQKLQSRLESLGATVIMTRTTDIGMTSDERVQKFIAAQPDLMISIHRNAATTAKPNGFGSYYFNAFSKSAAQHIFNATKAANLYSNDPWTALKFHYFYMCRFTPCPTVLTENGFMTNASEYNNLVKDEYNDDCADALTKGIVDYFKSIQ